MTKDNFLKIEFFNSHDKATTSWYYLIKYDINKKKQVF